MTLRRAIGLAIALGATAGPAGVTPPLDAAGAVDGRKTGKWGFHTANERDPWWQVDLGEVRPLGRAVLYNRCDGGFAARMKDFSLLLSTVASSRGWTRTPNAAGRSARRRNRN